jgi:hypothetical protein
MKCRHCGAELKLPLVDIGSAPPSNAYLTEPTLHAPEKWFPLRVLVCEHCWLAHTEDFAIPNTIHPEWPGVGVKVHRDLNRLKAQNLRNHVGETEGVLPLNSDSDQTGL